MFLIEFKNTFYGFELSNHIKKDTFLLTYEIGTLLSGISELIQACSIIIITNKGII